MSDPLGREEALADGQIGEKQAGIIAGAISLKSRSKRITDQFKPEPEVDKDENENLEAKEKRAWKASEFWMRTNGDAPPAVGSNSLTRRPNQVDLAAGFEMLLVPQQLLNHRPGT
ncbi:hypothetical protein [Aeromicrobium sp. P5_D10]